jgi:signal transduction histidine kinase
LRNLVDNARRHGRGPIELALHSPLGGDQGNSPLGGDHAHPPPGGDRTHLPGAEAHLVVRDHGPGIPNPADRERLVQPFQRGEVGRRTPGTGLGLAIVARVAERCGGSLGLEDAAPGLRAVIRLPIHWPAP